MSLKKIEKRKWIFLKEMFKKIMGLSLTVHKRQLSISQTLSDSVFLRVISDSIA